MDEFAATLDRDTAKIIAFNLQKVARQMGRAVIAATTHGDLAEDLNPSVHVHKRFGQEIHVSYHPNLAAKECSLTREMTVEEGSREDWKKLCSFHYRGHGVSVPRKIFRLTRGDELCGVIVYTYPPPACYGRRLVLPKMSMREINQQLSTINRVVIHPKYRTIGLGAKLIRETLLKTGTPNVELIAVMAKYSPFAEKAGMKKIAEQQPTKNLTKLTDALSDLGFNLQLLGSTQYVKSKLENLTPKQIQQIKQAFIANKHPRFKKELAGTKNQPYGETENYIKSINKATAEKIAKLIKLVAMLLQTKVYLFYKKV